jgi:hypothetical protein
VVAFRVHGYFLSFAGKQVIMDEHFLSGVPADISALKQKFDRQLDDLKEMLEHKRPDLPVGEWRDFVQLTRKSILEHPDQYLEGDLPTAEILVQVINAVFDDFLKDLSKK